MKQSVREAFVEFTARFEGVVVWMYQDILGLVSTGIGNLIDPVELALPLPFVHKGTEEPATPDEIRSEWTMVKRYPGAAKAGHLALQTVTSLRLTPAGVQLVVANKLAQNEAYLKKRFPAWDTWPADAQLATLSMAWACGPAFHFPQLAAALNDGNFARAAECCHIDDSHNPGVTPRNVANRRLYQLASCVPDTWPDPELLYYGSGYDVGEQAPKPLPDGPIIHPDPPLSPPDDEPPTAA